MALTKYSYIKAVNALVLRDEIDADPGIIVLLDHIEIDETAVDVWMADVLPGAEETALDAVVAAHTNPADPSMIPVLGIDAVPNDIYGSDSEVCIDGVNKKIHTKTAGAWDAGSTYEPIAGDVPFTPDGDIAATDTQAAIVEVRDDADTKLAGKSASSHTHGADDLSDVDTTTAAPSVGDRLEWDGTNWIPAAAGGGGGGEVDGQVVEVTTLAQTTSQAFVGLDIATTKITTNNTTPLDYLLSVHMSFGIDDNDEEVEVRLLKDGVPVTNSEFSQFNKKLGYTNTASCLYYFPAVGNGVEFTLEWRNVHTAAIDLHSNLRRLILRGLEP